MFLFIFFILAVLLTSGIGIIYHTSKSLEMSMTKSVQFLSCEYGKCSAFCRKFLTIIVSHSKIEHPLGMFCFFSSTFAISLIFLYILLIFTKVGIYFFFNNYNFCKMQINQMFIQILLQLIIFVWFVFHIVNHDSKILEMSHAKSIQWISKYYIFKKKIIPAFYLKKLHVLRICKPFFMIDDCIHNFLIRYRYIGYTLDRITCILENFFRDNQYDRLCPICIEICESKVTGCGHCVCHSCLSQIMNCPICRQPIVASQIIPFYDAAKAGRRVYN